MISDDITLSALRPGDLRPELLAPAGDMDCARAAVANGADAIYFGLDRFNAVARRPTSRWIPFRN